MAKRSNLYQRDSGRWTAYLRLNGEQVQRTFRTRDEALLWLARMEQKRVLQDEVVLPKKIRFADFADEWLRDYARTNVALRTYDGYRMSLQNHLVPYFGPLYLTQITRKKIDAFVADWAAGGPEYQERLRLACEREALRAREQRRPLRPSRLGRSAGTIKNAFVPLREMLGHAVGWGYLDVNPAVRINLPRPEWREEETIHALSGEQVEQLLAAAPAEYRTVFMTAVTTGVRLGELRALRWGDVDWDRERPRLHVRRSVTESGVFQKPKTPGSVRKIPIGPRLVSALREHRMRSRFKDESDLVFSNGNGGPLDGHNMVNRHFRPTLKKAGLPKVRFHDLRHTCATLLLKEGVPVTVVSKMLGHASAKMTLDTYSHVLPDSLDEASNAMEVAIYGARGALHAVGRGTPGRVPKHRARGPSQF